MTTNATRRSYCALGAMLLLATLVPPSALRAEPLPVLMVIANQDFWYQEYARVRKELAARGLPVVVAAGRPTAAVPQESGLRRTVTPDLPLSDVTAADYSAVVFVGGWGHRAISGRSPARTRDWHTGPTRSWPARSIGWSTTSSRRIST